MMKIDYKVFGLIDFCFVEKLLLVENIFEPLQRIQSFETHEIMCSMFQNALRMLLLFQLKCLR